MSARLILHGDFLSAIAASLLNKGNRQKRDNNL